MSFTPIRPFAAYDLAKAKCGITMALTRAKGRNRSQIRVVLRPHVLTESLWIVPGGAASFEVGEGEDAGFARFAKGGDFRLAKSSGKTKRAPSVLLYVPLFGSPAPGDQPATICDYRIDRDGAIIITLPTWLRPNPVAAVAPPVPPAPERPPVMPDQAKPKFAMSAPDMATINAGKNPALAPRRTS
jgi:hypothetical protein